MKCIELLKIAEKIDEYIYDINGVQFDEDDDENLETEVQEFFISYIIDLRKFDKSLDKCYKKLEKLFTNYTCANYDRIEEIEDSYLCIQVLLRKKL